MTACSAAPVPAILARPMRLERGPDGRWAGDAPLVFRSWLKACRKCARHEDLPAAVYYEDHHDQVERLITAKPVSVLLAVAHDNADVILGFACTEKLGGQTNVLHFAYTKKEERRRGVFRLLAIAAGLDLRRPFFYTAHPRSADRFFASFPSAVYRRDILGLAR